ncbi:acyl transferase/acyl hydrolase/lysophospholipase [Naviculisporaceae sp. PSN 640]
MGTGLHSRDEPIAIIGTACRFPGGCSSPSKLWDLYKQPRDVLTEIPTSRFNAAKFYHPDPSHPGTSNVRHSYLLSEDLRVFDAPFFNLKPSEATAMDPQHRILLEVSYEALESAGLPLPQLQSSSTGVFVGLMSADYSDRLSQDITNVPTYFASGTARSTLSNRVSHAFDLQGPSMTIDTACSSSLVALHQAVWSLRRGESSPAAIVAGTNLLLSPEPYVAGAKLNMLSPSGRSRMWDKAADGYGRGDGFAVLVLKKLSQAIADGDHVECVIRETGVNQDGRTRGITMPSARAQERLIKETYQRAGLDLARQEDRPQYFEAHGTGTPTGDPIEAEAISSVFFGNNVPRSDEIDPLYVGSGKTILGHSEGTAGVAGVLRASLALQNNTIPPNLLLNEISPKVAPFYTKLQIVKEAKSWPSTGAGRPKRASVNSFGFGGTNAHAILESYEQNKGAPSDFHGPFILPFNFSAACESSLKANLRAYTTLLQDRPDINLLDLAWTLDTRRTTLPSRISIAALSRQDLITKLQSASSSGTKAALAPHNPLSSKDSPNILAIFTGQGAQWGSMGTALLKYDFLVNRLKDLQNSLDTLPPRHAPSWCLHEELLKPPERSRIHEAEISQPLCTAVQILLVDLLLAARVKISAVTGHSSGEIAAAYAAGFISARDAIRIAYYRGYFIKQDERLVKGAMLAAGITPSDAQELCDLPTLEGRICIAARNSPTSVTLSGDADAIDEAREILEDEGKFARLLRVDKAYHSHHMADSAARYVKALEVLDIEVTTPSCQHPTWISSVLESSAQKVMTAFNDLGGSYWADNMVKPVLFSDAVQHYCEDIVSGGNVIHAVVEVGPHPALKKPTLETIQIASASGPVLDTLTKVASPPPGVTDEIPYISTLSRNSNDVEEMARALGSVWTIFGSNSTAVDFQSFYSTFYSNRVPQVIKSLPTYSWLHDRVYWHESRQVRALRQGTASPNSLFGVVCPDSITTSSIKHASLPNIPREIRYRNQLHFGTDTELAWLAGHKVQGSVVFPAAGYIAAVMEALRQMFGPQLDTFDLVEVSDFVIKKALVFPEGNSARVDDVAGASGVETLLSMRLVEERDKQLAYLFSVSSDTTGVAAAVSADTPLSLTENASGRVTLVLHVPEGQPLPAPSAYEAPAGQRFVDVNAHEFYTWARELGYEYDGEFLGLVDTRRRVDQSLGRILVPSDPSYSLPLLLHPALLDCAIQAMLLAYCYPGDNRMQSLHMPTRVDRLSIDLRGLQNEARSHSQPSLPFNASVEEASGDDIVGDAQVCSADRTRTLIQLQGLHITPLVKSSEKTDRNMFLNMTWAPERPTSGTVTWEDDSDLIEKPCPGIPSKRPISLASLTERLAFYYLRKLTIEFPPEKRAHMDFSSSHHGRLLDYADYVVSRVRNGTHPYVPAAAASGLPDNVDTRALSEALVKQYPSSIDLRVISAIGEGLPSAIRGEKNILEVMRDTDNGTSASTGSRSTMMDQFYATSLGMPKYLGEVARMVSQISHRFAHMNILEIGAGSGATTAAVLPALDGSFASYTFSDISSGYFAHAQDRFLDSVSSKMLFRVLDIEKDIVGQGFAERSYDLIVASLVLHATRDLSATMANVRRLLRPGGYLVLLEVTHNDSLRVGLISGGLPGWWLGGKHDGRIMSPCVSVDEWERLAVATGGFSRIEAITPHNEAVPVPLSVLVFQAVDDRVRLLRSPLRFATTKQLESLTIVGGTVKVVDGLRALLNNSYRLITHLSSLEDLVDSYKPEQETSLLSLVGLCDEAQLPVFEDFTQETLQGLQKAFREYKSILWVTVGARTGDNPYNNMLVGLQRSVLLEMRTGHEEDEPNLVRSRVLDFDLKLRSLYATVGDIDDTERIIANRLLQVEFECSLQKQVADELLWCSEPEQFVCMRDDHSTQPYEMPYEIQIPRMQTSKSANGRYNSAKRAGMVRDAALDDRSTVLSLSNSDGNYTVTARPFPSPSLSFAHSHQLVTVGLLHSLLEAVPLAPATAAFVSVGVIEDETEQSKLAIVLSPSLQSRIMIPRACTYELPASCSVESALLALLTLQLYLLSRRLHHVAAATRGSRTLVVLNPGEALAQILCEYSQELGSKVVLLTTKLPSSTSLLPWVYLHPRSTNSSIRNRLPANVHAVSVFVDMSPEKESRGLLESLRSFMPQGCRHLSRSDVMPPNASLDLAKVGLEAFDYFQKACTSSWESSQHGRYQTSEGQDTVSVDDLTGGNIQPGSRPTILSWPPTGETTIPLPVHPTSSTIQFSPSKTYWLAGLTSDLGLSLAEWMASRGARNIALSSRNPNIDKSWISNMMTKTGCSVRTFGNYDATSKQSVKDTYREICNTMPAIGGVVQGAMVLNDALLLTSNASDPKYFDRFNQVLEPKVQGSLHLHELFSSSSNSLDFFIMFSSLAYIVGNRGQSAYTAANAFMASLAARRRRLGLPASVVHLGAIVGPGYVSRELTAEKRAVLHRSGFSFLSEQDFWEVFAEGVLASKPTCKDEPSEFEIMAGLRIDQEGDGSKTFSWNPVFQHLIKKQSDQEASGDGLTAKHRNTDPLKVRLASLASEAEGYEMMLEHFVAKLENTLALPAASDAQAGHRLIAKSPDELGIDSLVAVDIQSWFRKELAVDVPVMRILNAQTIQDLLSWAWKHVDFSKMMPTCNLVGPTLRVENARPSPLSGLDKIGSGLISASDAACSSGPPTPTEWPPISGLTSPDKFPTRAASVFSESEKTGISTPRSEISMEHQASDAKADSTQSMQLVRTVPMSLAQSRFWFLHFLVQDKSAFNVTTLIRLNGRNNAPLDVARLERAFITVGQRHEAIRTKFFTDPITKVHLQGVMAHFPLRLEHTILQYSVDPELIESRVQNEVSQVRHHVFDLSRGETIKLKLLTVAGAREYYLVLGYHHIVMDGISQQVFLSELAKAYETNNIPPPGSLAVTSLQYPDYTLRQMREQQQNAWAEHTRYWHSQFSAIDLPARLPHFSSFASSSTARKTTANSEVPTFSSHIVKGPMDANLRAQIDAVCRTFRVSPSHFFLAVFRVFLFRHAIANDPDDESSLAGMDMSIGVGDAGRKHADVQDSLGLFLNLLPLRFRKTSSEMTFADSLLRETKRISDSAFANSAVPIDVLVQSIAKEYTGSNFGGLFQAFFNYRPPGIQNATSFLGCDAQGEMISAGGNSYDVSIDVTDGTLDSTTGATITMAVNSELYTATDAEVMRRSYLALLEGFARDPSLQIGQPTLYLEEDVKGAIEIGRGEERVAACSTWPETVVHRIDEVVVQNPDKVAINTVSAGSASPDINMTYREMANRIYSIASNLTGHVQAIARRDSVGAHRIAVFQAPGVDWVCSMLAILRIGAICVPLESSGTIPAERIVRIIRDAQVRHVLVDNTTKGQVENWTSLVESDAVTFIDVTSISSDPEAPTPTTQPQARPLDTAIITYTSGSTTGTPRGVPIRHESLTNFLENTPRERWLPDQDVSRLTVLQQSSFAFDMSIAQILACLALGGKLVIPSGKQRQDPGVLCELILSRGVTFTMATPTEYAAWLRLGGDKIRQALTEGSCHWAGAMSGGEALAPALVDLFRGVFPAPTSFRLINSYGPCETTFACADGVVPLHKSAGKESESDYGIGMTILSNYTVRIVNMDLKPVPTGVLGQIVIGGAGVAKGYDHGIQSDKFTSDKQHRSSFSLRKGWTTEHFTGDLGKLDKDGNLTIHGRIPGRGSTQVKIGGVRMDLVEIEGILLETLAPVGVTEVVVSCRDQAFLAAFVVLSLEVKTTESTLMKMIKEAPLPQNMCPTVLRVLQAIPKTLSNKTDRAKVDALPLAITHEAEVTMTNSPRSFEDKLLGIWKDLLPGTPSTSSLDDDQNKDEIDFFHAGGNSLALLSLQVLIKERLGINVSIAELFGSTSLSNMASLLESKTPQVHNTSSGAHHEAAGASQSTNSEAGGMLVANSPGTDLNRDTIDWDQETSIDEFTSQIVDHHLSRPKKANSPPQVVALTGATGYLGKEILRQLVEDPAITHIHCLAVRTLPVPSSSEEITTMTITENGTKIIYHKGDLTKPNLGLPDAAAAEVFDTLDAIIHAGADVSFMKSYTALKASNLYSTKEIAKLAVPRGVTVHYISTAGVAVLATGASQVSEGEPEVGEVSLKRFPPTSQQLESGQITGYIATKWASEVFLERISERYGLPVVVHRPSYITAPRTSSSSATSPVTTVTVAASNSNADHARGEVSLDLTENMINFARKTRTVPDLSHWTGYFDSISVEEATRVIISGVTKGSGDETDSRNIRYVYESGETVIAVKSLGAAIMEGTTKISDAEQDKWEVLAMEKWVDVVAEAGMNPLLVAYLRKSVVGRRLAFPRLVKST